jgi:fructoselysine 6-kinase
VASIIGVGDNTVDRYLHLGQMFPGGNTVNVPVFARRHGHTASYVGWIGTDRYGRLLLDSMAAEGIDTSRCRVVEGASSHGDVTLVDGDRVFGEFDWGVTTRIALDDDQLAFIGEHDVAHTSAYSKLEAQLPRLAEAARVLSFDFTSDWTREYLERALPWTDIAFLSHPEPDEVAIRSLLEWVHGHGPTLVVVTAGIAGAFAYDGRKVYRQDIVETEVVDTLGAGDAFAARLLVEVHGGTPLADALGLAAESAAVTCGYLGAYGHGVPIEEG